MHMSHHDISTGAAKSAKQLGKLRYKTKLSFQCYTVKDTKTWHRHDRQNTTEQKPSTVNPNDRRPATLTNEAPDSTSKSMHESSRITPTSTATLHARLMHLASTTPTKQSYRQSPLSPHNPVRVAGGPSRTITPTPPATAGTHAATSIVMFSMVENDSGLRLSVI